MLLPDVNQSGAAVDTIFENGTLTVGPDEISAVQMPEDSVVLQVNGVPVEVNPESILLPNEMASSRIFAAGTLTLGVDEITAAQREKAPEDKVVLQVNGEPFEVNPIFVRVGQDDLEA